MFKIRWAGWGLALVALLVTTAFWARAWRQEHGAVLPVLGTVPEFSFTERSGRTVTRENLRGQVWVADFIFTRCEGPCPTMCMQMATVQKAVAAMPDVKLVSFSVDPEYDKPAVLREYASHFGASATQWLFLTGDKAGLYKMANNGLKLAVFSRTPGTAALDAVEIDHSTHFALIDRAGRIRGYYDGMSSSVEKKLLPAIVALLDETPPVTASLAK